ncbi:MAG TPA: hypothetical protein VKB76_17960, partial [Ktedonobacterales bacterium]|nr:hypothetical protein [Ktedonobacterales bacterium]
MTHDRNQPSRRSFLGFAGATMFAATATSAQSTEHIDLEYALTGNGEWTYKVTGWGALPAGVTFGGTHGAIAQDIAGNVYVSTQSATGILVYAPDGRLLKTIAHDFPEVHSMIHAEENGVEYFYTTVQKGTPSENWLFVKMRLDGTPVLKITAPPQAGFKDPNEWRL